MPSLQRVAPHQAAGTAMKRGKHHPVPPATAPILEVLDLLAVLGWKPEDSEAR